MMEPKGTTAMRLFIESQEWIRELLSSVGTGLSDASRRLNSSCPAIAIYADCVNLSALPGIHVFAALK
jgi:hypothetical protein